MNLNIVQSTVVGTIRNLQEMKKSYQELPQVDEQMQKPKKKSFKGLVSRQNSQFSKNQQKSKIQSQHSQNENKLKQQQQLSEQSIANKEEAKEEAKQEIKQEATQDEIQNDLEDQMNLDPDDFDDKLIEKYKQIKIQEQEQQKTFIQCLNYNKSHEMFQGIEYNQIFSYIIEKGKYIQDFVDKHDLNQQFLEKHLINDFHFLKGFEKLIQDMITNGQLVAQGNNWNEKQVKKIEKYIMERLQFVIKEQNAFQKYQGLLKQFIDIQNNIQEMITKQLNSVKKSIEENKNYFVQI